MEDGAECDTAAIVKVIEAETAAYFNKDFAAWARCWVQTPHVRHWGWYPHSGIQVLDGWEANSEYMRAEYGAVSLARTIQRPRSGGSG